MKFVIAMLQHETNSFSPLPTRLQDFGTLTGGGPPGGGAAAIEALAGTAMPFAAFLDLAREAGAEVSVPLAAYAEPSGPVADAAFEAMVDAICTAVAAGCDAVLLDLHGAMVTESRDDGEGALLRRIRRIAPEVPIAVALDFHANLTADICASADVVAGYLTYPHVDMYETGLRAGRSLLAHLEGAARPRLLWGMRPMMPHMIKQTPSREPMKGIMARALAAEAEGRVLNASVFGGFPLSDIPRPWLSAAVVCDAGQAAAGQVLLDEMLDLAWQRRADFVFTPEPLAAAVARAKAMTAGPVVLADHGDNCGAGGSHDDMTAIAEVLRQGLDNVAVAPICDPEAVAAMAAAGEGQAITLAVGGKVDAPAIGLKAEPLTLTGRVKRVVPGRFAITGPMQTGVTVNLGRSAVLDCGAMELIVSEARSEPCDPGYFTHAGIDPLRKRYLLVKSRQHFRAGFADIAKEVVLLAGRGVCNSDYGSFPFAKLERPAYPLDSLPGNVPDAT